MTSNKHATQTKPQWQITDDFIDSMKHTHSQSTFWYSSNTTAECLQVVKEQLLLRDSLHDLRLEVKALSGEVDTSRLQSLLHNAGAGAEQLHRFLNRALDGDPLVNLPTNSSAVKARQVFETAELAEMILLELAPRDLLVASKVNQAFAASVAGSVKLQTKLSYQADPDSIWRSTFDEHARDNYKMASRFWSQLLVGRPATLSTTEREEREVYFRARISHGRRFGGDSFPVVPRKYHAMLICQPPVTEIVATPSCWATFIHYRERYPEHVPEAPAPVQFSSPTGLTVGDLLYIAKQLYADHQYCPYANEILHDMKGEVHPDIDFDRLCLSIQTIRRSMWTIVMTTRAAGIQK